MKTRRLEMGWTGMAVILTLAGWGHSLAAAEGWGVTGVVHHAWIRWDAPEARDLPGRVLPASPGDPGARLEIENTEGGERRVRLLTLHQPAVKGGAYGLRLGVRYDGVEGSAFLETWNFFPGPGGTTNEAAYFSRTLGAAGPLATLQGSSHGTWSERIVPFFSEGRRPTRVEFNLVLPGKGRVALQPVLWLGEEQAVREALGLPAAPALRGVKIGVLGAALGLLGAWIGYRRWRRTVETRRMLAVDLGART